MAKEKKTNPILFILFAIIIPLIVVATIAIIGLSFVGVDVKGKASQLPVISSFIKDDETKELENKVEKQIETIALKDEQIDDLTRDVDGLKNMVDELELDLKKKENRDKSDEKTESDEVLENDELKQAASSYRKMDPENAASIISQMADPDAIDILQNLPSEVRGEILAAMEPKKAAQLTKLMMNQ